MPDNKPSSGAKVPLTPALINLGQAAKAWWSNLKKFIFVYLWGALFALVALVVAALFLGLDYWLGHGANAALNVIMASLAILSVLVAIYFFIRAYMGLFLLVKNNYEGKEWDVFQATEPLFWPYLGLAVLTTVFVLLWSLLLIIPGLIYGVFYSLAVYVFFFEGQRGMKAIRRSVRLVEGYWWPVFWRYVIIGVLAWIVLLLFSWPLYLSNPGSTFSQVWNVLVQLVNFLIGPLVLLYTYGIYRDLAKIKKAD